MKVSAKSCMISKQTWSHSLLEIQKDENEYISYDFIYTIRIKSHICRAPPNCREVPMVTFCYCQQDMLTLSYLCIVLPKIDMPAGGTCWGVWIPIVLCSLIHAFCSLQSYLWNTWSSDFMTCCHFSLGGKMNEWLTSNLLNTDLSSRVSIPMGYL
jgi:hypothetical protein